MHEEGAGRHSPPIATGQAAPRSATLSDAPAIAEIYNQGIEDRVATFETEHRSEADIRSWFDRPYPIVVIELDGTIVSYATGSQYRPRACYHGVVEFSVYVHRDHRGRGFGKRALTRFMEECRDLGYWKLLSRIFPENEASLRLCAALGFRTVGVYHRHGMLDGVWRDTVIVEKLLNGSSSPESIG